MRMHKALSAMIVGGMLGVVAPASAQLELIWSDEFDGGSLDTSVWERQIGDGSNYGLPPGWGNNELQYYTDFEFNSFVQDGSLHIAVFDIPFAGSPYSSARLRTLGNFDFRYGKIEARIKLPKGQGLWPAFWLLPTNSPYGGWASSGEIDVMEAVNQMTTVHGTLHFGSPWPNNASAGGTVGGLDYSQDYHVYAVEWEPDQFRWSVDGQVYRTLTNNAWFSTAATSNPRAPFDSDFHLLLNVAVGGNFPGDPNGSASFPQEMLVDYVRVYQQAQAPRGGTPHAIPGRVESEDFDEGYAGQAFNDCDAGNNGGAYRPDSDVDIQASSEGGFNIGWICQGEWLEYTVAVQSAGTYTLRARVASLATGGDLSFEADGADISGTMSFGPTGGWQNWATIESQVELGAGEQVIRVLNRGSAGDEYNFNWFELEALTVACGDADLAEPIGTLDFSDVGAFLVAFGSMDSAADLAAPFGTIDFSDVIAFLASFGAGCP